MPKMKKMDPYANLGLRLQPYMDSLAMAESTLANGINVPSSYINVSSG